MVAGAGGHCSGPPAHGRKCEGLLGNEADDDDVDDG